MNVNEKVKMNKEDRELIRETEELQEESKWARKELRRVFNF